MTATPTATRLLDTALTVLGERGARELTVRAVETAAELPHGSIRHHFGDRRGMLVALFDHLEQVESAGSAAAAQRESTDAPDPAELVLATLEQWLGPGRTVALARYELFLLAARDAELRAPLLRARQRFVAAAASLVGPARAPAVVAALDGLVLDALVRGEHDRAALSAAVADLLRG